jgi:hypothetical protein
MAVNNSRGQVEVTGWVGWVYLAAFVLLLSGIFQLIAGLVALLNGGVYAISDGTVMIFNLTTWGWIHLILGIVVVCTGTALFSGKTWARVVAVILAIINLVTFFLFIGVHPLWSIIVMVLDLLVIYALTVHGNEVAEVGRE